MTSQHTLEEQKKHETIDEQKIAMYEASQTAGEITVIGKVSEIAPRASWLGAISVKERLNSGAITEQNVQNGVEQLEKFFVPTTMGARLRCIDGRPIENYDDSKPEWYRRPLGPQTPGGSPAQAISYRLGRGDSSTDFSRACLRSDLGLLAGLADKSGYRAGNHSDDVNATNAHGKTGCGAIDTIEEQLAMFSHETLTGVEELTKALMDEDYDQDSFDRVLTASVRMRGVKSQYFPEKKELIEELKRHNSDAISILSGVHQEVIVNVNNIRGTTFHRDHYAAHFDNKIQTFNFDVWYSRTLAPLLAPNDTKLQSAYLHARMALASATLMLLTDGSLQVTSRSARD